jgi:hypothetical protein
MNALLEEFSKDEPDTKPKMMQKLMAGMGQKTGLKGMIGMA